MDGSLLTRYCNCGFGEELFVKEGEITRCAICSKELMPLELKIKLKKTDPGIGKKIKLKNNILVVDDQYFFRQFLTDLLTKEGYNVDQVEDGLQAIKYVINIFKELVRDYKIKMPFIILDICMPGLINGMQALGILKAINEDLSVIVLTSNPPEKKLLLALEELGAKKYINKKAKNLADLILKNIAGLTEDKEAEKLSPLNPL
ncbi:MAG: response regulator [bacterium]